MYAAAKAILCVYIHVKIVLTFTLTGSMRQSLHLMSNLQTAEELETTLCHKWQSSSMGAVNTGCSSSVSPGCLRCSCGACTTRGFFFFFLTCQFHLLHFHPSTFSNITAVGVILKSGRWAPTHSWPPPGSWGLPGGTCSASFLGHLQTDRWDQGVCGWVER